MVEPFWEAAFRDPDSMEFGEPSERIGPILDRLVPGHCVLDAGCGSGRNALEAARRGMRVRAFDRSEAGVAKLEELARRSGLTIDSWVGTLDRFDWDREYDLILLHGVLQFVEKGGRSFVEQAKSHTSARGIHVLSVFTDVEPVPEDLVPFVMYPFAPDELRQWYADWEILEDRSYIKQDEHEGGLEHTHSLCDFIARRPRCCSRARGSLARRRR